MSKEYWFPWTPARFRGDTMHLSAEQDGIYRRLIDHYMETGLPLPDNDAALARIAGISGDSWAMAAAILRPFFRQAEGKLFLKRCDEILEDQTARSRKNAEKGKAGASKRWKPAIDNPQEDDNCHTTALSEPSIEDATGQDKTLQEKKSKPPNPPVDAPDYFGRNRLDPQIPPAWLAECQTEMGWAKNVAMDIWTKFSGHQGRKVGQAALKTSEEWAADWRTWYRKENIKPSVKVIGQSEPVVELTEEQHEQQRKWHRKMGIQHATYNPEGVREAVA